MTYLAGLFTGVALGIWLMALLATARRADREWMRATCVHCRRSIDTAVCQECSVDEQDRAR